MFTYETPVSACNPLQFELNMSLTLKMRPQGFDSLYMIFAAGVGGPGKKLSSE